ncbi:preprotein translocase subunit SecE [Candidatus Saccharibacteria bacterium]|nr:preprotein translocase subunit SecE [Candidatus Saccharibacteria bacterium]
MARVRKEPVKKTKRQRKTRRKLTPVTKFFSAIKKLILTVLRPFKFVLKPFQNKVFRSIGRFFRKILLIDYFMYSWQEVKMVEWPSRKETIKLTTAVFIFAIVFGFFVSIIDYGLDKLFKEVIL